MFLNENLMSILIVLSDVLLAQGKNLCGHGRELGIQLNHMVDVSNTTFDPKASVGVEIQ